MKQDLIRHLDALNGMTVSTQSIGIQQPERPHRFHGTRKLTTIPLEVFAANLAYLRFDGNGIDI